MSVDMNFIYMVVGMGIVTYLPRMIPAAFLSKIKIPKLFIKFLSHIPEAVLAALLFPSILMPGGQLALAITNDLLLASIITLPIAYKSKNMFLTVIVGMVIMIFLQQL
jgi:branched-subunit amino acid transport protein